MHFFSPFSFCILFSSLLRNAFSSIFLPFYDMKFHSVHFLNVSCLPSMTNPLSGDWPRSSNIIGEDDHEFLYHLVVYWCGEC